MKIGIDARLWSETGVGRYIRNLVQGLGEIKNDNQYVLFALTKDVENIKYQIANSKNNFELVQVNIRWHTIREQIEFPRVLNKYNLDLVHFPYFSVPVLYKRPYILTLHDLIVNSFSTGKASTLPYPLFLLKKTGYSYVVKNAMKKAKKIIVPTNAVKENIKELYPTLSTSISVVYEGGFREAKNPKLILSGKKYFLRVGNFYPHKNVESLLFAFKMFKEKNNDISLVLAGKEDYFFEKIKQKVQNLGIDKDVVFVNSPTDQELENFYRNALALVIPSFMEGFSLTAVEALSLGCPVLASDIPVHREVCQDSVLYCNPSNPHDIKQQLIKIAEIDTKIRNNYIKKGLDRARFFSWSKMVKETIIIYESCISLRQS